MADTRDMEESGLNTAPLDVPLGATLDVERAASRCLVEVTGITCAGDIAASCFLAVVLPPLHSTTPLGPSVLGRGLDKALVGLLISAPSLSEKSRWIRFSADGVPGEWSGPVGSERESSC